MSIQRRSRSFSVIVPWARSFSEPEQNTATVGISSRLHSSHSRAPLGTSIVNTGPFLSRHQRSQIGLNARQSGHHSPWNNTRAMPSDPLSSPLSLDDVICSVVEVHLSGEGQGSLPLLLSRLPLVGHYCFFAFPLALAAIRMMPAIPTIGNSSTWNSGMAADGEIAKVSSS